MSAPTGAARRRGPFAAGDRVQLTDPKGRMHTVTLTPGRSFHTHQGSFPLDELIGRSEGWVVTNTAGVEYLALRPLLSDFVLSMPRGAAVVYPKDSGQILAIADIFPGARVVEAGAGSGALSMSLLQAIGDTGVLWSFERREDFAEIARVNVETWFGAPHPAWRLTVGDLVENLTSPPSEAADSPGASEVDRVVLDMLAPWECLDAVAGVLAPGGVLVAYVATVTQLSRLAEAVRDSSGYTEPAASECMVRGWHLEGLAVRPEHRMVGHTGFLLTTRRLAPGVTPPARRRRPAKGAYGEPVAESGPPTARSLRMTRRALRAAAATLGESRAITGSAGPEGEVGEITTGAASREHGAGEGSAASHGRPAGSHEEATTGSGSTEPQAVTPLASLEPAAATRSAGADDAATTRPTAAHGEPVTEPGPGLDL